MSTILYTNKNGKTESVLVEANEVDSLLSNGYTCCPKDLKKVTKAKVTKAKVTQSE